MPRPFTFNFADLLELVARAVGDRPAVSCGGRELDYRGLWRRIDGVARTLLAAGIAGGDRVGLQLANSIEFVEAFFAICRVGATPVNVNYRYQADELAYLYRAMDLAAVIHGAEADATVRAALRSAARTVRRILVGAVASGAVASDPADAPVPYEAIGPRPGAPEPQDAARSDDDAILLCTGGTTGLPKGVEWGARDLFFGALGGGGFFHPAGPVSVPEDLLRRVPECPPLVSIPLAPLMHGAALWSTLASLFAGHKIVLSTAPSFDAEQIWSLCEREGVNLMTIVGDAMALPLVSALEAHPGRWQLGRLSYIGSGGALFSDHLQQRLKTVLPHLTLGNSMGSSEAGVLGMGAKPEGGGFIRIPPREDLAVIVDRSRLARVGEAGVIARSGHMPRGYFGDAQKTAETFVAIAGRRYALTGDTARQEPDGSFVVFGRGSTCINTGGEKVFPEEVEEVLRSHPAVADALVVGVSDDRWGERVTGVISCLPGATVTAEDLRRHCRAHLAGYKVPKDLAFVGHIPRSIAGKADYGWARRTMLESLGVS